MSIITKDLIGFLRQHFVLDWQGIHGVSHWARVRQNALLISQQTGADNQVLELFAFLHDAAREDELKDPGHGLRAVGLIEVLQGSYFHLNSLQLEQLMLACEMHSEGFTQNNDITVMTCWDADRLDLGRIGIMPDPNYLCTDAAKDPAVIEWAFLNSKK